MAGLGVSHYMLYERNQKRWCIPDHFLKNNRMEQDLQDPKWLQIRASQWGLCNLLCKEKLKKLNPTLKHSEGLQWLLEKRKKAMDDYFKESTENLFDVEQAHVPKRRRRALASTYVPSAVPHSVDLDVDMGTLTVMWPTRSTEDLHINFTKEQVTLFLDYMWETGVQLEGQNRQYQRKNA